jgi:hypothetical protein
MVAFDAGILSIVIYENAGIPNDYRTGLPIDRARERIDALIDILEQDGDCVLLPTPALGEALTSVAEHAERYIEKLENLSCFKIHPFGKREAIEIALRTKAAIAAGDKKEGLEAPWQKVKYDRQIIATAKAERVDAIYSTDKHIHANAGLWGVPSIHLADLPLPSSSNAQIAMFAWFCVACDAPVEGRDTVCESCQQTGPHRQRA